MSNLFTGPSPLTPWVEQSVYNAILRRGNPADRTKIGQVIAVRRHEALVSDGAHCIHLRIPGQNLHMGAVVKISRWKVCASEKDQTVHLKAEQVEELGAYGMRTVGEPMDVHQAIDVRRAIAAIRPQKVADVLKEPPVRVLKPIATSNPPLPLGDVQALLADEEAFESFIKFRKENHPDSQQAVFHAYGANGKVAVVVEDVGQMSTLFSNVLGTLDSNPLNASTTASTEKEPYSSPKGGEEKESNNNLENCEHGNKETNERAEEMARDRHHAESNFAGRKDSMGDWREEEQVAFLSALKKYGKDYDKISAALQTRTVAQVQTHAELYHKELQQIAEKTAEEDICLRILSGQLNPTTSEQGPASLEGRHEVEEEGASEGASAPMVNNPYNKQHLAHENQADATTGQVDATQEENVCVLGHESSSDESSDEEDMGISSMLIPQAQDQVGEEEAHVGTATKLDKADETTTTPSPPNDNHNDEWKNDEVEHEIVEDLKENEACQANDKSSLETDQHNQSFAHEQECQPGGGVTEHSAQEVEDKHESNLESPDFETQDPSILDMLNNSGVASQIDHEEDRTPSMPRLLSVSDRDAALSQLPSETNLLQDHPSSKLPESLFDRWTRVARASSRQRLQDPRGCARLGSDIIDGYLTRGEVERV